MLHKKEQGFHVIPKNQPWDLLLGRPHTVSILLAPNTGAFVTKGFDTISGFWREGYRISLKEDVKKVL